MRRYVSSALFEQGGDTGYVDTASDQQHLELQLADIAAGYAAHLLENYGAMWLARATCTSSIMAFG